MHCLCTHSATAERLLTDLRMDTPNILKPGPLANRAHLDAERAVAAGDSPQRQALWRHPAAVRVRRRLHPPVVLPAPLELGAVRKLAAAKAVPLAAQPFAWMS